MKIVGKTKDGRNKWLHDFNLDVVMEKATEVIDGVSVKVSNTVNLEEVKKWIQDKFYKNNLELKSCA